MLQVDLEQGGLNLSRDSEQREIDEFEEEERRLLAEESKVIFFLENMLVFSVLEIFSLNLFYSSKIKL